MYDEFENERVDEQNISGNTIYLELISQIEEKSFQSLKYSCACQNIDDLYFWTGKAASPGDVGMLLKASGFVKDDVELAEWPFMPSGK